MHETSPLGYKKWSVTESGLVKEWSSREKALLWKDYPMNAGSISSFKCFLEIQHFVTRILLRIYPVKISSSKRHDDWLIVFPIISKKKRGTLMDHGSIHQSFTSLPFSSQRLVINSISGPSFHNRRVVSWKEFWYCYERAATSSIFFLNNFLGIRSKMRY